MNQAATVPVVLSRLQITGADDGPIARHGTDHAGLDNLQTVHQPDRHGAGGRVAPQDIGPAVAVEVALADDLPAARDGTQASRLGNLPTVHQPERGDAAGAAPEQIAHAAGIEVVTGVRVLLAEDPNRAGVGTVTRPADD